MKKHTDSAAPVFKEAAQRTRAGIADAPVLIATGVINVTLSLEIAAVAGDIRPRRDDVWQIADEAT